MELKVLKIDGTETGRTVTLNDNIFGIEPNQHVIWLDVKQYLATIVKVLIPVKKNQCYQEVHVN